MRGSSGLNDLERNDDRVTGLLLAPGARQAARGDMARTISTKGLTKAQLKRFRQMLVDKAEEIRANLQSAKASKALSREVGS